MYTSRCLMRGALAAFLLALPTAVRAIDDSPTTTAATAEKTPEAPAADVTTQGSVDVKGQHILYTATVGIITVGANDTQDGQLGMDGKPLPGSELALSEPKEPKDAPPVARMSYVAYFKKDAKAEERPVTFFYNGGPGSSTVWLHMGSLGPMRVRTRRWTGWPMALHMRRTWRFLPSWMTRRRTPGDSTPTAAGAVRPSSSSMPWRSWRRMA